MIRDASNFLENFFSGKFFFGFSEKFRIFLSRFRFEHLQEILTFDCPESPSHFLANIPQPIFGETAKDFVSFLLRLLYRDVVEDIRIRFGTEEIRSEKIPIGECRIDETNRKYFHLFPADIFAF
jgi:hypothetical protein